MSIRPKACFFTGHRIIETKRRREVEGWLREKILDKINDKVEIFITGGALGFDTMAAEQVLFMREDYQDIRLWLYLPCTNQDQEWTPSERDKYEEIKKQADKVCYITKSEYTDGCMKKRNRAMVDASDCGIAYVKTSHSGAAQTVKMAMKKGLDVVNIADMIEEN